MLKWTLTVKFQAGSVDPMTLNLPLPSTQLDRIRKLFQGTPLKI